MGQLIPTPELSLDFKPTFIPKTITQFLGEISTIGSVSEKILKIDDFITRFEMEITKIDAFKRELPLCMLLMNDAIDVLKEEVMMFKKSANKPVLEQFIPLNKTCHEEDRKVETDTGDKKNWLSSTHLWNIDNTDSNEYRIPKQNSVTKVMQKRTEERQDGMINYPYCGNSVLSLITPGIKNPIFVMETGGNNTLLPCSIPDVQSNIQIGSPQPRPQPQPQPRPQPQPQPQPQLQPPQQQTCRKQRRCWSTELHRRFVSALQQLGGSKVATPKQIRDLMGVDGLTNDEVKSHLQKYRLHTKRVPSTVAMGGLWAPSQDHYVEKHLNSQSGSPDGPLPNYTNGGTSTTFGDSMDDGEDEKSENNCWKGHLYTSGKDNV